jgi:hypothetical protein
MLYNVCSRTELIRSLEENRQKIVEVEGKLSPGYLAAQDLEDLIIFCNRVAFVRN